MKKNASKHILCWLLMVILSLSCLTVSLGESYQPALASQLEPYMVSFDDHMAVRLLADGSIEVTLDDYAQAEWDEFEREGDSWAVHYSDEEYQAEIDEVVASSEKLLAYNDYVSVATGHSGTLAAIHQDGTVEFNIRCEYQCDVSPTNKKWRNIQEIALGAYSALGLKKDGTAVVSCDSGPYRYQVGTNPTKWKNIVSVANDFFALGLRDDGTVQYAAWDEDLSSTDGYVPLKTIADWKEIVQVATSWYAAYGLRADGTVAFAGATEDNKDDVGDWSDIVKIATSQYFTVGLKKDGTLVSTQPSAIIDYEGNSPDNVVDVYANRYYTLAILADGTTRLLGIPEEYAWTVHDGTRSAGEWVFPLNPEAVAEMPAPAAAEGWTCLACKAENQQYDFCTSCGAKKSEIKSCPACGWEAPQPDINFCGKCGTKLSPASPDYSGLASAAIGDVVSFGHYEQDNSTGSKEPIDWVVMDADENKLLLYSVAILDAQPYDKKGEDSGWLDSSLRAWLNDTFLNEAFTAQEQGMLAAGIPFGKASYSADDRVFLLAYDGSVSPITASQLGLGSVFIESNLVGTGLENTGITEFELAPATAYATKLSANADAYFWEQGGSLKNNHPSGDRCFYYLETNKVYGVRPAIWLQLPN